VSGDSGSVVRPRPGRAFYAPAVRLSRLGADGNTGGEILDQVQGDVTDVEVTLLANGIATYSITLNNAYLSTRVERDVDASVLSQEQQQSTTLLSSGNNPVWPRFKYDAFRHFAFGMRLRIDMRYFPPDTDASTAQRSAQANWVPMVAGPIADMRFTFAEDGLKLQLSGQDDLSRLQDKQSRRSNFDRKAEMSLVREALRRGGLPAMVAPALEPPAFADDDANGLHEQIQAGQSLFDFIDKFVKKLDFELFMDFANLDSPDAALEVHFEPCRSRRTPDQDNVFTLEYGKNLLDFRPTFKVRDQYSAVTVRGRHRDPQIPEEVRGEASASLLADELFPVDGETLTPAPEVRNHFFPNRPNEPSRPNGGNLDSARAQREAEAGLRKMARDLLTIEATTLGSPRLRPGQHVLLSGLRAPFDGYFYVTQTKHTLNDAGYRTQIHACRPGMQIPDNAWSPA
jgi:hypothetical protein